MVTVTGLTIDQSFKEEFNDPSNPSTIEFTRDIERATYVTMKRNHSNLINVRVTELKPGSVKVTLELSFDIKDETDAPDTDVVENDLVQAVHGGYIPGVFSLFLSQ